MDIRVRFVFEERGALRLLAWLAHENAEFLRARPDLPYLYSAGVRYQREEQELWSDYWHLLEAGHEDCDALAAARCAELNVRGHRALHPRYLADTDRYLRELGVNVSAWRTDVAYRRAKAGAVVHAEPFMLTKTDPQVPGGYHCVVRYRVGDVWFFDDPSARLGMYGRHRLDRDPTAHRFARPQRA